ncbi:MAG: hypothetical protein JWN94_896 [Betaproteobacteria bacterium]|nr:hypothetical protein [Betaproteobacteria bacterium]
MMCAKTVACCLWLLVAGHVGAADLYEEANKLRSGVGRCASARPLPPLRPVPALERAAREMARGSTLERSLAAAGYRAMSASFFSLSGDGVESLAAQAFAARVECRQLMDPEMSEAGFYVEGNELRMVIAAPFAPAVRMTEQAAGQRVLELVNQARATPRLCGNKKLGAAKPLRWNNKLAAAAQAHADDMARFNYFNHTARDGSNPEQRVERAGYRYRATGENIAAGQMKPEDAVAGWIKSPPHCENLMKPVYTEMGVAYAVNRQSELGVYWAQEFGLPR